MKSLIYTALLLAAVATSFAQVVDTTVCDVLNNPQSFDGKIVRIKGTAIAGFDEFAIKGSSCGKQINSIWLAYPEGAKAKAGPVAFLRLQLAKNNPAEVASSSRNPVTLDKNKDFSTFDNALAWAPKIKGTCLGCVRNTVNATFVGRIDAVSSPELKRDASGKIVGITGFGNANMYSARLVLQSVSDVVPQEIDYTKNPDVAKDDSSSSSGSDPVVTAHEAAKAFGAGSDAAKQIERAAAAFGKRGDDNGVEIGFGGSNEVPKNDGLKGTKNSPDGVLYLCTFDMDRLKGDALSQAIVHVGSHVADLRENSLSGPNFSLLNLEAHAWQTTVLSVVAQRHKTLTVPGGYVLWDTGWTQAERGKNVMEGTAKYLTEFDAFGK